MLLDIQAEIIFSLINSDSDDSNEVSENSLNICLLEFFVAKNDENRVKNCVEFVKNVLENKYLRGFLKFDQRLKILKCISYK